MVLNSTAVYLVTNHSSLLWDLAKSSKVSLKLLIITFEDFITVPYRLGPRTVEVSEL